MQAAVTRRAGSMELVELPEPPPPGPGEVELSPAAVGICGSDYHFFAGHLSDAAGGSQFPRIQGHEVAGTISALGPGCRAGLRVGQQVAVFPLRACGQCYPCRVGKPNTCDNFSLTGVHADGGLQRRLILPQQQVYPIGVADPAVAATAEPVSIAVRAVNRARVVPGERAVVLGAGPIGQCIGVVAAERGADLLLVDLQDRRLELASKLGAQTLRWDSADQVIDFARGWAGDGGPPVVFDATGAATAVQAMVAMVASAGRAVQVGMSNEPAVIRVGILTEKELDLLGVSCCNAAEFADAVAVVERNASRLAHLVSHQFPLAQAAEAIRFAMTSPTEVMKVVIRCD
jgi:L-gulonate 5-dehydrogenase